LKYFRRRGSYLGKEGRKKIKTSGRGKTGSRMRTALSMKRGGREKRKRNQPEVQGRQKKRDEVGGKEQLREGGGKEV